MLEGKTEFEAIKEKIVTKKMDGFFNPEMKYVRDLTLAILTSWDKIELRIGLPLAGTGVRALRILNELPKNKISYVYANDHDKKTFETLTKNKEKLNDDRLFIANEEADEFLLYRKGFDYIDLDPYGSPNPFLDPAIKRISNNGILGVTATDIKALAGTAKMGGLRKYWQYPEVGNHERGLRILIKKIMMVGAQYDKALTPILSISKAHYYRIFFRVKKSKTLAGKMLAIEKIPLHNGEAKLIINNMKKVNEEDNFNNLLEEEINSKLTDQNHFDIHKYCKKHVISQVPKNEDIIKKLKAKKYKASRSHICRTAIWTNADEKILKKIIN